MRPTTWVGRCPEIAEENDTEVVVGPEGTQEALRGLSVYERGVCTRRWKIRTIWL